MKKKSSHRVLATLLLTLFFCFPLYLISRPFAATIELRRTGGLFPGESLCTNSGCHQDSPANSGPGGLSVTANGMPINEYEYTPGELVSLMVKISDPSAARWGFQMTARTDNGCLQAGSFQAGEEAVEVRSNTATIAPCPMATIEFPVHRVAKEGQTGEMTYLVNWTAPTEDIGPIKFAAAGNAGNGNNLETGDHIYTLRETVDPAALPPPMPAIAPTGVVIANLLPTINAISRDSIISIFGSDFAPPGFRDLDTQVDPATGLVATNQSGVCVEIDGERSPMFHVLSNQINLQAPSLEGQSPVSVVVITNCDTPDAQRSMPEPVQLIDRTPAFFVEPIVDPGGPTRSRLCTKMESVWWAILNSRLCTKMESVWWAILNSGPVPRRPSPANSSAFSARASGSQIHLFKQGKSPRTCFLMGALPTLTVLLASP